MKRKISVPKPKDVKKGSATGALSRRQAKTTKADKLSVSDDVASKRRVVKSSSQKQKEKEGDIPVMATVPIGRGSRLARPLRISNTVRAEYGLERP